MVIAGIPMRRDPPHQGSAGLAGCRAARKAKPKAQEGRQEGEAAVTLRLLNRRCSPLSDATTAQIQALPLGQLEALADALLDFTGPDDLAAWLAANA